MKRVLRDRGQGEGLMHWKSWRSRTRRLGSSDQPGVAMNWGGRGSRKELDHQNFLPVTNLIGSLWGLFIFDQWGHKSLKSILYFVRFLTSSYENSWMAKVSLRNEQPRLPDNWWNMEKVRDFCFKTGLLYPHHQWREKGMHIGSWPSLYPRYASENVYTLGADLWDFQHGEMLRSNHDSWLHLSSA